MIRGALILILTFLVTFGELIAQFRPSLEDAASYGKIAGSDLTDPKKALSAFFSKAGCENREIEWVLNGSDVTTEKEKVFRFAGYYQGFRVENADAVVILTWQNIWEITAPETRNFSFQSPSQRSVSQGNFATMLPEAFHKLQNTSIEKLWKYESHKEQYELVWKLEGFYPQELVPVGGILNPETGEFIPSRGHICFADSAGFAHTRYHGNCIVPAWYENGIFTLKSKQRGQRIETINLNHQTGYSQVTSFEDADNIWGPVFPTGGEYATDAHYCAVKYYDFLQAAFSRNSLDNNGYPLVSYMNYGQGLVNAFWNGNSVVYGSGNGTTQPYTTLDIAGHEFTHGLIQKTANLNYSGEPGTINEAIADMLGAALEFYGNPQQANWTLAESSGTTLRSMAFPKQYNQPDTYHGAFWYYGSGDNGGVHINSGFLNKWFYLISNGGQGINDAGFSYNIQGVGIEKATQIVYETLLSRLVPASDFNDFRNGTLLATQSSYGACSPEAITCLKAWEAVGFGISASSAISLSTLSGTTFCDGDSLLIFTQPFPGASYDWYFNGQLHSNTSTPYQYANSEGHWHVVRRYCNEVAVSGQVYLQRLALPVVTTSDETICAGTNILPVSFPSGGTYSIPLPWSGPTVNYSYTFTDAAGCSASATGVIAVVPLPQAEITTQIQSVALNHGPLKLEGTGDGIFTGTGVSNNWFYPEIAGVGGPYEIHYAVENSNGCHSENTFEITVTPPCQLLPETVDFDIKGDMISGEEVILTLNDISPELKISWHLPSNCNYTISDNGLSITLTVGANTVDVSVTISNECGDELNIAKKLTFVQQQLIFTVFPNPVKETLNIVVKGSEVNQITFKIYNYLGEQVLKGKGNTPDFTIPIGEMRTGWYIVEINVNERLYRIPVEKIK